MRPSKLELYKLRTMHRQQLLRKIEDILGMQLADDPLLAGIALEDAREHGLEDVKRWRGLLRSQAEYIKSL
jgi:hypothetical protein